MTTRIVRKDMVLLMALLVVMAMNWALPSQTEARQVRNNTRTSVNRNVNRHVNRFLTGYGLQIDRNLSIWVRREYELPFRFTGQLEKMTIEVKNDKQ